MGAEKNHDEERPDDVIPEEGDAPVETNEPVEDTPVDEIVSADDLAALKEAAGKAQEFQDNWLRAVAELQNVQKRTARDKDLARRMAVRDIVRSLLPCFDNLERAVQSADASSPEVLIQGVSMVSGEIARLLTESGVAVIDPVNERLDPTRHEAVFSRHDADVDENVILEVHEKGYSLGEMIIRPARVTVSLGPEPADHREEAGGSDADAGEED